MKMSLKSKLLIMFFLCISMPLLILGGMSIATSSKSNTTTAKENTSDIIEIAAKNLEKNTQKMDKDILGLGSRSVTVLTGKGSEGSKTSLIKSINDSKNELIENVTVTDVKGKVVMTNEDKYLNADLSVEEIVKNALNGETSMSKDISTSEATGNKVVTKAYPLKNGDKVVGTIVATISFSELTKEVLDVTPGKTGYSFLMDRNGLIIKHPVKEKEFVENLGGTSDKDLNTIVEKIKAGETGTGSYKYEGEMKFMGYIPVGNWVLAITQPYNEIMVATDNIIKYTGIVSVIVLILSMIIVTFATNKSLMKPIKDLEELMYKAGLGDLTVRSNIQTKDELQKLSESFNDMISNQSQIINNVRTNAEDLAASSEEISASTEEISASTESVTANMKDVAESLQNQNKMILETSDVLVDLSSLVKVAQDKTIVTKNNSINTMDVAKTGRKKVEETVEAINNINNATIETEVALNSLEDLSSKIVGIISTINGIAEQTNLLALNAAIEAARAGEHGRGFSVVADEVRKLSEESSVGAKEISSLVNNMVDEIKTAVKTMNNSKEAVNNGVIVANETDKAFLNIINSVEQIVGDIEQIGNITKNEVANSDKIVKLLNSVSVIAKNTANAGRDVALASEEQYTMISHITDSSQVTSTMAMNLNEIVDKFIIKEKK